MRTPQYLFAFSKLQLEISLIVIAANKKTVAINMKIIMKRIMMVSPCGLLTLLVELV